MKRFEGKTVIVTGGSTGIGRAAALAFGREGANVVIAARGIENGEEAAQLVRDSGGHALFVKTDVSDSAQVQAMVNQTVETFGRLDYAVNSAGVGGKGSYVADYDEAEWDDLMTISVRGMFLVLKYELRQMLAQGGTGYSIVNVSSVGAMLGVPGNSAYIAAKHAVLGLTRTAALEYINSGIRINAFCPHMVRTPMVEKGFAARPELGEMLKAATPIGRMAELEEASGPILWLCSDEASYVVGAGMVVDGGLSTQ